MTTPGAARRAAADARRARRSEVHSVSIVIEAAAAFLAIRPRSVAETGRRLRHLGYPAALVAGALERLVELGYLDDRAFALAWVESRDRSRPRGALVLRRELSLKGVPRPLIDAVLAEREAAHAVGVAMQDAAPGAAPGTSVDVAAAERLLERRRAALEREPDPRRRRQRAYALLARHGFDPDVCTLVSAAAHGADLDGR